jgi:hypothetical protein
VTVPPDSRSGALECEAAIQRLVTCHESGGRPADDAALAAHLGSCLGCFRAAADLKDVPRLAALLREAPDHATAQVQSLFATLPARMGDAFDRRLSLPEATPALAPSNAAAPRPAPPTDAPATAWQRFIRWIRMPVPAAMAGAACATAVALVMTRPPSLKVPLPVTTVGEDGVAAESAANLLGQDDVAFAQSGSVYDSVEELDATTLARVRDSFGSAVEEALTPHAQLAADDDDPGVGATSTAPNPATVSDDLDQLDEQGLKALQAELGGGQ